MKIGELARKTGYSVETIRYYEKKGLLPAPLRNFENNYRQYSSAHLEKLLFIRRCRSLDMTHEEILSLQRSIDIPNSQCGPIDEVIRTHLLHVQQRIQELLTLETQLKELRDYCNSDRKVNECGIVKKLTLSEKSSATLYSLEKGPLKGSH
ncbi:Cd(II)/Pb(II)-responsive transcriptional regulator [Rosenbergiella nectarea]|uniref:Cd(II)/Pb(II)-responsive transcriptional regulator n=1 Tax=Rosenbergiella nectarea TaxID=988801 RepID=UPI001F4DB350|nr:Cd(II)/Pb(II)-responsive transcriptional regulator [Rosenbergiella nectarea]